MYFSNSSATVCGRASELQHQKNLMGFQDVGLSVLALLLTPSLPFHSALGVLTARILECIAIKKQKKQRLADKTPSSQSYGFLSSYVRM